MAVELNRRMFLRSGTGLILLPQLECMLTDKALAAKAGPTHYAQFYIANGVVANAWNSSSINNLSASMKPIADLGLKNNALIVQGLVNTNVGAMLAILSGTQHGVAAVSAFTGMRYHFGKRNQGGYLALPVTSIDQRIANMYETPVHSLVGSATPASAAIKGDERFTGEQMKYLSFQKGYRVPNEYNTLSMFNRLFGKFKQSGDPSIDAKKLEVSILSDALDDLRSIRSSGKLSSADKNRINQYLTGIREAEQKLLAEKEDPKDGQCKPPERSDYDVDASSLGNTNRRGDLMMELAALGFQCGLTNAASIMYIFEHHKHALVHSVKGLGGVAAHSASHYNLNGTAYHHTRMAAWQVEKACRFAKMLKDIDDVDGKSFLSKTVVAIAGGLGDSETHSPHSCPMILLHDTDAFAKGKIITSGMAHANALFTILKGFGSAATTQGVGNTIVPGMLR